MLLVHSKKLILNVTVILLLAGCGGGGGGSAVPPNPNPFSFSEIRDLTPNYSRTISLTGSDNFGDSYTASLTRNVHAQIDDGGELVTPVEQIVNINNISTGGFVTGISWRYYRAGNELKRIELISRGITCTPNGSYGLPASATIGKAGTVGVLDCSDGGTETTSWRLEASGNNAKLVLTFTGRTFGGTLEYSEDDSYLINTNGDILGLEVRLYEPPDFTLNLSGQ